MSCHDSSHYKNELYHDSQMQTLTQTQKVNATAMRHPMRHICMPTNQTINDIYIQCNILLNENKSVPQSVFAKKNHFK